MLAVRWNMKSLACKSELVGCESPWKHLGLAILVQGHMYEPASKLSRLERSGKGCDQRPIRGLSSIVSAGLFLLVLSVHSVISDEHLPAVLAYRGVRNAVLRSKLPHVTLGRTASWNA